MDNLASVLTILLFLLKKSDIHPYMLKGLTSKRAFVFAILTLPNPPGQRNGRNSSNYIAINIETKTAKTTLFLKLLEERHNSLVGL